MTSMRFLAFSASLLCINAIGLAADPPAAGVEKSAELKVLDRCVGTWDGKVTLKIPE